MSELLIFPDRLKYRIFRHPVNLQNDVNGLGKIVFNHLGKTGDGERIVYFFFNKKQGALKALYFDERAAYVIKIILKKDIFTLPGFEKDQKTLDLDPITLMLMIRGMKLTAKRSA